MKKSIVIFLVAMVSLVIFKDLMTHAFFYANQDYVAKYLCINKERPQVMCQGQCFLENAIEANHNSDSDDNTSIRVEEERINIIYTAIRSELALPYLFEGVSNREPILSATHHYHFSYLKDIFHPPSLLCSLL